MTRLAASTARLLVASAVPIPPAPLRASVRATAPLRKHRHAADLSVVLAAGREKTFQSAEGINRSLAELFTLLAKDRVSPRRAAVLAYIGSLLLRTLPAIEKEHAPADPKNSRPTIIWDLPRPSHERVPEQRS
jgi:hypothetical protein